MQVNGVELFVEELGEGRPFLAFHGGLGLDHSYFRPWLEPLATRARLILFDQRGNGRSQRFPDGRGLDHATWVADADALRARLGHERVVLFGHSYGAFLALAYAVAHPERLAGLILCAAAPAFDYPEVVQANAVARGTPAMLEALGRAFTAPPTEDSDFRALWNTVLPLYFRRFEPRFGVEMDRAMSYSAAGYAAGNRALATYDVRSRLGVLARVPVLLLTGEHDWITPPAQGAQRIADELPHALLERFAESGHFPFIEEQARFLAVVDRWLDELPSP